MKLVKGKQTKPRRTLMYGIHGVGKSTWASKAKNHVFLNFEDGLHDIDCVSTEPIQDWPTVRTVLMELHNEPKQLDWIVIDTLDWLETMIHGVVAAEADKESIADIGYGNGYKQAVAKWRSLIGMLDQLRNARNCGIIALAHADIKRFDAPDSDSYDRYVPALHQLASNLWQEWCDEVFFANYKVYLRKEDTGFNRERSVAFGDGERFIRAQESPAVLAKNRLGLPAEFPFNFAEYEAAIKANKTQTKKA